MARTTGADRKQRHKADSFKQPFQQVHSTKRHRNKCQSRQERDNIQKHGIQILCSKPFIFVKQVCRSQEFCTDIQKTCDIIRIIRNRIHQKFVRQLHKRIFPKRFRI